MHFANGWLSFELGVLRRLTFSSVAFPFTGEPELALQLKRWKIRVATNDPMLWSYTKGIALIENHGERLSDEDLETKFRTNAGRVLPEERIEELDAALKALEGPLSVGEVMQLSRA